MRPRISSHLTYYLRASNPHLETLNEEDVDILLHYIIKHCCPDMEEELDMDDLLSTAYLWLASDKLTELQDELHEHPPVYSKEEQRIYEQMQKEIPWERNALVRMYVELDWEAIGDEGVYDVPKMKQYIHDLFRKQHGMLEKDGFYNNGTTESFGKILFELAEKEWFKRYLKKLLWQEHDGSMAPDEWRETNLTIRFCNLKYWKK
ncbi:MAG: hypothetical protein SOU16_01445 [Faecalimonas sp.]|nr:hypothetical protein [Faecalimonas sp.]